MSIHYYLSIFPMEAMIASELEPEAFGAYMALGSRKGSAERLMFFEVNQDIVALGFDIDYARRHCVSHSDGRLKNSVYLSVYRVLEALPADGLGTLYLITKDGRCLSLAKAEYVESAGSSDAYLYQELCPTHPLVVSSLAPRHFVRYMVEDSSKVRVPKIVFADLTMPDLENRSYTGNTGGYFDKMYDHLQSCLDDLRTGTGKMTKVVDRSADAGFNYQVVGSGFFVGGGGGTIAFYAMPSREELKKHHYDWSKSALIF